MRDAKLFARLRDEMNRVMQQRAPSESDASTDDGDSDGDSDSEGDAVAEAALTAAGEEPTNAPPTSARGPSAVVRRLLSGESPHSSCLLYTSPSPRDRG